MYILSGCVHHTFAIREGSTYNNILMQITLLLNSAMYIVIRIAMSNANLNIIYNYNNDVIKTFYM